MFRKGSIWIGALFLAVLSAACAQSDAGITTEVKAKLEADRSVSNSSAIQVETRSKVVTLTGTAGTTAEKQRVVQLVKQTEGVKDVVDNINVAPIAAAPAPAEAGGPTPDPNAPATPGSSSLPPEGSPTTPPTR